MKATIQSVHTGVDELCLDDFGAEANDKVQLSVFLQNGNERRINIIIDQDGGTVYVEQYTENGRLNVSSVGIKIV